MSLVTRMNESCHTYEWVTPHTWMRHVTHMNESYHTHFKESWVTSLSWAFLFFSKINSSSRATAAAYSEKKKRHTHSCLHVCLYKHKFSEVRSAAFFLCWIWKWACINFFESNFIENAFCRATFSEVRCTAIFYSKFGIELAQFYFESKLTENTFSQKTFSEVRCTAVFYSKFLSELFFLESDLTENAFFWETFSADSLPIFLENAFSRECATL